MNEDQLNKVRSFFNRLISSDTKESSKRVLAIYIVIVLGTIITVYSMVNGVDFIILLVTWLGFAAALLGMSEYNKNRTKKYDTDVEIEKAKNVENKGDEPELIDDSEV